ncbi:MAG: exo-alpha-sialidase [Anaerolineae bacterium]|nr:exo-alpha-sialidase [Anaerolineae bacterium]
MPPPRTLLLMLENELHGVVEESADIAPPREIVLMLENELQTQLDDKALIYSSTRKEPYWDETLVIDPNRDYSYLVWIDNTGGYSTIYATRAQADGQTLSEPVIINQSLDRAFNPILAVDAGGTLYVVWRTRHHLDMGIYFARSTNVGQTWSKSTRINDEIRRAFNPSLAVDSQGHLYIAWQNRAGINAGIYLAHSSDGGQTWIEERRVAN